MGEAGRGLRRLFKFKPFGFSTMLTPPPYGGGREGAEAAIQIQTLRVWGSLHCSFLRYNETGTDPVKYPFRFDGLKMMACN